MKLITPLLLIIILWPQCVLAIPDCYAKAANPAHEFAFLPKDFIGEVTSLTPDGKGCDNVAFYKDAPLVRRKLYAPMRNVYESYAHAVEKGQGATARRIFTYLRPTPRSFPLWLWLANSPEEAPMPWGMDMMSKLFNILKPYTEFIPSAYGRDDFNRQILNLEIAWPLLFLMTGGVVYPDDEWMVSKLKPGRVTQLLNWRFPTFVPEVKNEDNKYYMRLP